MKYALAFALAFALSLPCAVAAITIDTVPVGDPGNLGRADGPGIFGAVSTSYRIATTEVTNAQYVQFLNAVAASDPNGLYNTNMSFGSRGGITRAGSSGSYTYSVKADAPDVGPNESTYTYGDKPVVYVSWYDAARFANWVNNGATASASTETGAYTMATGLTVSRNPGATWFLPTENQWYKAAYYNGTSGAYFNYPTKSNTPPDNVLPSEDSGNSANYYAGGFTNGPVPNGSSYPFTTAGAYTDSLSPYGTADQGGNVWEWTEAFGSNADGSTNTSFRIRRGGAADTDVTKINSSFRENKAPTTENDNMGFRLATIAILAGVPGDYNANNVVDAADYALWRKYSGQSVALPNDSTPGTVTSADYDVWRAHFGQTSAGSGSSDLMQATVPEPGTIALIATLTIAALFCGPVSRSSRSRVYRS